MRIFINLEFEKPDLSIIISISFSIENSTDTNEYNDKQKV